jgi:hypothetical protein
MALYDNRNPSLAIAGQEQLFDRAFSWEPKRQHQFILSVPDIPAYLIKTSAKPTINNGEVTLDMINIKRYVKGKSEWNEISMTLYDPIVPSGAQAVMEWIRLHHESSTGRDGYSSFYKKQIKLSQLSPLGETVEEWILNGAFLVSAEFGAYDWGNDGVQEINISVRYDWAFLSF